MGTPSFVGASALTKLNRKKNSKNAAAAGIGGLNEMYPSGLTLSALHLLNSSSNNDTMGMMTSMTGHMDVQRMDNHHHHHIDGNGNAATTTATKIKGDNASGQYYSTGLTPANNDSPFELSPNNDTTPFSGDINMDSVFSPSLFASPRSDGRSNMGCSGT